MTNCINKFVLTTCQMFPTMFHMSETEHETKNDKATENLANDSHRETPFVNLEKIACRYGVCERTIQNMKRKRQIPYHKFGRCIRFKVADCDKANQFPILGLPLADFTKPVIQFLKSIVCLIADSISRFKNWVVHHPVLNKKLF